MLLMKVGVFDIYFFEQVSKCLEKYILENFTLLTPCQNFPQFQQVLKTTKKLQVSEIPQFPL